MEEKKNILTYAGLKKLEDELHDLKVNKRKEVAGKIKEAREQGDLSENAEYDAAKEALTNIAMQIAAMNPQYISRADMKMQNTMQQKMSSVISKHVLKKLKKF